MNSLARGNVRSAINSVRSTKWRSFFTMLGIVIGVVSVVCVVSIGEGVKHQAASQISHVGKDLITIRPKELIGNSDQPGQVDLFGSIKASGTLSGSDIATVEGTPGVGLVEPLSIVTGVPKSNQGTDKTAVVIGSNSDLPEILNQTIAYGSFFDSSDSGQNVAVLGTDVARQMFSDAVPLGQSFQFRGQDFVVMGVLDKFDAPPLLNVADFNNAIFIPFDTAAQVTSDKAPIYEILAKPANSSRTDQMAKALQQRLLSAHGGQNDFEVLRQSQSLVAADNILDLLTRLIAGVAVISLLVGGIGIMNVMLVSVTERMHEIGIRKAVGATDRQILSQFVTESAVLSLTGGIIGLAVAFVADELVGLLTDIKPAITWWVVLLALVVPLLMGVVFGAAPAIKAARKNPIDALRHE